MFPTQQQHHDPDTSNSSARRLSHSAPTDHAQDYPSSSSASSAGGGGSGGSSPDTPNINITPTLAPISNPIQHPNSYRHQSRYSVQDAPFNPSRVFHPHVSSTTRPFVLPPESHPPGSFQAVHVVHSQYLPSGSQSYHYTSHATPADPSQLHWKAYATQPQLRGGFADTQNVLLRGGTEASSSPSGSSYPTYDSPASRLPELPSDPSNHGDPDEQLITDEAYLRWQLKLPPGVPINLDSIPDPQPGCKPELSLPLLVKAAIFGSPGKKLTLGAICKALENRFECFRGQDNKAWKHSIRHSLSLHHVFKNERRPITEKGKGGYWVLDLTLDGVTRQRKRKTKRKRAATQAKEKAKGKSSSHEAELEEQSNVSSSRSDSPDLGKPSTSLQAGSSIAILGPGNVGPYRAAPSSRRSSPYPQIGTSSQSSASRRSSFARTPQVVPSAGNPMAQPPQRLQEHLYPQLYTMAPLQLRPTSNSDALHPTSIFSQPPAPWSLDPNQEMRFASLPFPLSHMQPPISAGSVQFSGGSFQGYPAGYGQSPVGFGGQGYRYHGSGTLAEAPIYKVPIFDREGAADARHHHDELNREKDPDQERFQR